MKNFKNVVVYQIWPRSFYDSDGDGIGDLKGIIEKLEYLARLNIDYIWLSPIYTTGNKDYGYDIDDYYAVNPEFGTMQDFEDLVYAARRYNIEILMDLVANHTSDQHKWFRNALSDPNSPYRDYYFFKKGRKGSFSKKIKRPPNNWMSTFGGCAWQREEGTDQYYLTTFTPNQCDLNWDNPKVREGIYKVMEFWLEKGVAGFRLDVINTISKTKDLPFAGKSKGKLTFPFEHIISLPKSHKYVQEMHKRITSKYSCITIGEGMMADIEDVCFYTAPHRRELDMMFQFDLHLIGCGPLGKFDFRKSYKWRVEDLKELIILWQLEVEKNHGWLANYLSNHDQPRQVSRFGDDMRYRRSSAKALALLNFTLRGTPFIYQGEEIGMTNCKLEIDEWRDYEAINGLKALQKMMHLPKGIAKKIIQKMSRDNARTPMQWNKQPNAGFTTGEPWIKVNPNFKKINVVTDKKHSDSLIMFYEQLITMRKREAALNYGNFIPICREHKYIIAYIRIYEMDRILVVINLSPKYTAVDMSEIYEQSQDGVFLMSTHETDEIRQKMKLSPYEGFVYKI